MLVLCCSSCHFELGERDVDYPRLSSFILSFIISFVLFLFITFVAALLALLCGPLILRHV